MVTPLLFPNKGEQGLRRVMALMGEIKKIFGQQFKLTLIAERPFVPIDDTIISEQTMDDVEKFVVRAKARRDAQAAPSSLILPS